MQHVALCNSHRNPWYSSHGLNRCQACTKLCSSTATHIVVCLQQLTVHEQVLLQILEGIVPGLLRKKEEEEKRLRVAQRMQRQMDNIMLDENGGFGRCALCP